VSAERCLSSRCLAVGLYITIYTCVFVCVCVCVWERERERERKEKYCFLSGMKIWRCGDEPSHIFNLCARWNSKLHGQHRKQSRYCYVIRGNVFIEPLRRNGHGTDPQETSYVLAVTCLSVRYLAVHVTIIIYKRSLFIYICILFQLMRWFIRLGSGLIYGRILSSHCNTSALCS
jgi:hypothetical protein